MRKREFCERERETVVGKGSGSRSCVCREREGGVCLIGKQMNNVSFITGMETERRPQQMLCMQESNFSGMSHI